MEILLAIIVLQFAFMVYSDVQNRKERERLQLKLMSKSLGEYVASTEEVEDSVQEKDPYIDVDAMNVDQILKAKEK